MSTSNLITLPVDIKRIERENVEIYILTNRKPISLEDSKLQIDSFFSVN